MATLAVLNTATTATTISSSEYNDNMTRIRAAVNTIDAAQLNTDSVTTVKIVDANVTEAKLATDSVTADKLASDAVTEDKILDATITYAKLAAATILSLQDKYELRTYLRNAADASGDVSYTGFAFQPDDIEILGGITGTGAFSIGFSDGTLNYCSNLNDNGDIGECAMRTTNCLYINTGAGSAQSAIVKTMDSAGFTLTWTKGGSPTGTLVINVVARKRG